MDDLYWTYLLKWMIEGYSAFIEQLQVGGIPKYVKIGTTECFCFREHCYLRGYQHHFLRPNRVYNEKPTWFVRKIMCEKVPFPCQSRLLKDTQGYKLKIRGLIPPSKSITWSLFHYFSAKVWNPATSPKFHGQSLCSGFSHMFIGFSILIIHIFRGFPKPSIFGVPHISSSKWHTIFQRPGIGPISHAKNPGGDCLQLLFPGLCPDNAEREAL